MRKITKLVLAAVGCFGLIGITAGVSDAAYDNCADGYSRVAARVTGDSFHYPNVCTLAQCVRAVPEQRVDIYTWYPVLGWRYEATYRSRYEAVNQFRMMCPASVQSTGWVR